MRIRDHETMQVQEPLCLPGAGAETEPRAVAQLWAGPAALLWLHLLPGWVVNAKVPCLLQPCPGVAIHDMGHKMGEQNRRADCFTPPLMLDARWVGMCLHTAHTATCPAGCNGVDNGRWRMHNVM